VAKKKVSESTAATTPASADIYSVQNDRLQISAADLGTAPTLPPPMNFVPAGNKPKSQFDSELFAATGVAIAATREILRSDTRETTTASLTRAIRIPGNDVPLESLTKAFLETLKTFPQFNAYRCGAELRIYAEVKPCIVTRDTAPTITNDATVTIFNFSTDNVSCAMPLLSPGQSANLVIGSSAIQAIPDDEGVRFAHFANVTLIYDAVAIDVSESLLFLDEVERQLINAGG
jgi:hypothetical protein